MRKEAKLSRIPAEDEASVNVPIKFLGMAFDVTAPASQADEIDWKWSQWARPLKELYQNSLEYKTVPTLKTGTRRAVAKTKFMLSMSDENWMFNWSKSQQIMEINVEAKINKAKVRRLAAFAIGIMLYDFGIKPAAKTYFARKVKRDKIKLDGIQKFLKFLKDGMALGRPRAAFAFGFMMHMEQVGKALRGHPLHAMVGEILFDKDTFETDAEGYERFQVDDDSPLNYEFDPERFDTLLNGMSPRQARELKNSTWGGRSFEEAMDMTGIGPFQNALKKNVIAIVKNPNHEKHSQVLRGLGLRRPEDLQEDKFFVAFTSRDGADGTTGSSSIYSALYYRPNGRNSSGIKLSRADRTNITRNTHYNSYVIVEPAFRRLGAGMHMTASQIEAGLKQGRKKITVYAALAGGWKTWNQFGFESDNPFLSEAGRTSAARTWADKSAYQRLVEMGDVDRQEVMKDLVTEMVSKYRLKLRNGSQTTPPPPPPPAHPLPSNRAADVLKIMNFVRNVHSSYSDKMRNMLSGAGLPTTTNLRDLKNWYTTNTVTKAQQQTVHDYFKDISGMSASFRTQWGYPPRTSSRSTTSQTTMAAIDTWMVNKIIEWDWFNGQPFDKNAVLTLLSSPQFDVAHGLDNLKDLIKYLKGKSLDKNLTTLTKHRLTAESQTMQDCMDCEGFNKWWKNQGSSPSWHGHVDLSDGKYSLAVLAMDQYRKLKIEEFPELANDPAYQRSRVASAEIKEQLQGTIDPDIIESMSGVDADGGIDALDMAFMEMGLRKAHQIRKDMKAETPVRVASRWLGVK